MGFYLNKGQQMFILVQSKSNTCIKLFCSCFNLGIIALVPLLGTHEKQDIYFPLQGDVNMVTYYVRVSYGALLVVELKGGLRYHKYRSLVRVPDTTDVLTTWSDTLNGRQCVLQVWLYLVQIRESAKTFIDTTRRDKAKVLNLLDLLYEE